MENRHALLEIPKSRGSLRFLVIASLFLTQALIPTDLVYANRDWRSEMLNQINIIREEVGVKPLLLCTSLNNSSQNYAANMARNDFFSHNGKNGSTLISRTKKAGYVATSEARKFAIGENIAKGQISVKEVMRAWRNSKGHYKNMIDVNFTHVGFGRSKDENSMNKLFWVQNFGTGGNCTEELKRTYRSGP